MKQKDIVFILISSTFVVALWITFNILHGVLTSTINSNTTQDIQQINGTFDTKTLQLLKKRQLILPQSAIATQPTPTPTPTVAPITPVLPLQSVTIPVASDGGTTQ